jgi:Tfp pilus assembly protein PilN
MKAVNLLPSDLRGAGKPAPAAVAPGAQAAGRAGAFAVLGVLAFSVVALAAYVLTSNTVKDRQATLAQVSAQSDALTQRAAKLKSFADYQSAAQMRISTVKDLADSRFNWEQALRDLSRAIPANVALSQMTGSISGGATGGGDDPLRPSINAPAITLKGCSSDQHSVATLLSRLHAVRGVTRVSLSSSAKPDQSSTTISSAGSTTLCKGKRPPVFSVVVFFEHASVPASSTDTSVATGSTGASGTSAGTTTGTTGTSTPASATPTATPSTTPGS